MKEIPLTRGFVALVDDEDYPALSQHRWYAKIEPGTVYAIRGKWINGKKLRIAMHRVILGIDAGDPRMADHINGNGLDNRRSNLRPCDKKQNMLNSRNQVTKSGFRGVYFSRNKVNPWQAWFTYAQKTTYIGYYKTPEDAARARDAFARQHPAAEFVKYNFAD